MHEQPSLLERQTNRWARRCAGTPRNAGRQGQSGFTLIELTIVAAITTVVTVLGARFVANEALESTAEATGYYLDTVRGGIERYMEVNFNALQNGLPVPGYAVALQPTVAELRADGRLIGAFPLFTPFNSTVQTTITRVGCPGALCRMDAVTHQVAPLLDSSGQPQYGLASTVRLASRGGLAADPWRQNRLAGPNGDFPNPLGTQGGVIGVTTALDAAVFNQFVRRNDDRLTTLNEALTLNAGPLATGGVALSVNGNQATTGNSTVGGALTVGGLTTLNNNAQINGNAILRDGGGATCVNLDRTGVVTILCTGTLNARTGVFTDGAGNTSTVSPTGVVATGRVNGNAGLATNSATLFDALNPDRITVTGNQAFVFGAGGRMVSFDDGDVVAERNVSATRVSLRSPIVAGAGCANTSGAIGAGVEFAATATGGMAVCRGGRWISLQEVAAQGAVCPTESSVAVDGTTNVGLLCRGGRWTRTSSLLSSFVLIKTETVTNDSVINHPSCVPNGGAFAGEPLLLLQAGNEGSSDATFNRFALNLGSTWQIKLTDSTGNPLGGARAIAMSYCLYAP